MHQDRWFFTFGAGIIVGGIGIWLYILGEGWLGPRFVWRLVGLAVSSGVVIVAGWLRKEHLHWQALQQQRMANTLALISNYIQDIREPMNAFVHDFLEMFAEQFGDDERSKEVLVAQNYFGRTRDLAGLLHRLDQIGMQLHYPGYVFRDTVLSAITSEVARLLLDERFRASINFLMETSTLAYIDELMKMLDDYREGKRAGFFKRQVTPLKR